MDDEFQMMPYDVDIFEMHRRAAAGQCQKCISSTFVNNVCMGCGRKRESWELKYRG